MNLKGLSVVFSWLYISGKIVPKSHVLSDENHFDTEILICILVSIYWSECNTTVILFSFNTAASLFIEHLYFHMDSVCSFPLDPRMKLFFVLSLHHWP